MMVHNEIGEYRYFLQKSDVKVSKEKVVIIYHGWGGAAQSYSDLAEVLVKEGYTVIVPEIIFHDTREPLPNHFDKHITQDYFWKTIMTTIDEFHDFIHLLPIKLEDTIVIGSSMGGLIANGIYAKEPRISGLVNINGSGSFVVTEEIFRMRDKREKMTVKEEDILKHYDPKGKHVNDHSILLMHGDKDTTMSIEGQRDYYNYLIKTEKRTNVDFRIFNHVNHVFTEEMIDTLIDWLKSK